MATIDEMKQIFAKSNEELLERLDRKYEERLVMLEGRLTEVEAENKILKTELKSQSQRFTDLEKAVLESKRHAVQNEQNARRCNIRVYGVAEKEGENCKTEIYKIIRNKLSHPILDTDIVEAHRVGIKRGERPRGIIVRMSSLAVKKTVLPKRRALKGSGIVFAEDLCRDMQLTLNRVQEDKRLMNTWASDGKIFATLRNQQNAKFRILYGQSVTDAINRLQ